MNDLIPIGSFNNKETVNARDLHEFMGVKTKFIDWIKRRIDEYGFEKDNDFIILLKNGKNSGRPAEEYHVSVDMAKELGMVEKNEKGGEIRRWFIDRDKKLSSREQLDSLKLVDPNLSSLKFIADDLRVNPASRTLMYEKCLRELGHDAAIKALPDYSEEKSTEALSTLLKRNNVGLSAAKANKILIEAGILEEKERRSSKGEMKKYKSLTDEGLVYGKNLISRNNQRETQPHYYADKFDDLVGILMSND